MDILLAFIIILLVFLLYFIIRNDNVLRFRLNICQLCSEYEQRKIENGTFNPDNLSFNWFLDKYSYGRMVLSFRPLKLEYWYTDEEIKEINS